MGDPRSASRGVSSGTARPAWNTFTTFFGVYWSVHPMSATDTRSPSEVPQRTKFAMIAM